MVVASGLKKTRKRKGEEGNGDRDKKGIDKERFKDGGQRGGRNDGIREIG